MAKYTRGKLAVLQIALVSAGTPDTAPTVSGDWKQVVATNEIKIGLDTKTITFHNFATGGDDQEVPTGITPSLSIGEAQWTDDDLTLSMMETAIRNGDDLWYRYFPKGVVDGKGYLGKLLVKKWEQTSPSDGLITVAHDLSPQGVPTKTHRRPERGLARHLDGSPDVVIIAPGDVKAGVIRGSHRAAGHAASEPAPHRLGRLWAALPAGAAPAPLE